MDWNLWMWGVGQREGARVSEGELNLSTIYI
jgi:hypothetical protein